MQQKLNNQQAILVRLIPLAIDDPLIATFVMGVSIILLIKAELEDA